MWPNRAPYKHLMPLMGEDYTRLSNRAAAGFLSRLERGHLRVPEDFRLDLKEHIEVPHRARLMHGPDIIARTLSVPRPFGPSKQMLQYHSRSDHHSKVVLLGDRFRSPLDQLTPSAACCRREGLHRGEPHHGRLQDIEEERSGSRHRTTGDRSTICEEQSHLARHR